ncbi:hypothetical protein KP003_14330 [Geomonas nitrogeniifigens]|uniref:hypothetical protein n=1 Tax=Geomonas diazotrophica TaxID=2843197 RepID=UPI001C2C16DC|nr:hypothetical protein [Geomonas nitrogeniifigens]QXE85554.1 hypothetical protein KP003_14330 [Geomonas nitrogeniifigens]
MKDHNQEFRMFDVYLGVLRRKEDFFTYFLASCLDYCYRTHRPVFRDILTLTFGIEGVTDDFCLLSPKEASPYFAAELRLHEQYTGSSIMREFPLPAKDGRTYYLDLAFLVQTSAGSLPLFVGIEGKVFDTSVKPGQMARYWNSLNTIIRQPQSPARKFLLLSTLGVGSLAEAEVMETRKSFPHTGLIVWGEFAPHFEKIQNDYFQHAWRDAYHQLQLNAESDRCQEKKEPVPMYGLARYLNDEEHFDVLSRLSCDAGNPEAVRNRRGEEVDLFLSRFSEQELEDLCDWFIALFGRARNMTPRLSGDDGLDLKPLLRAKLEAEESEDQCGELAEELFRIAGRDGLPSFITGQLSQVAALARQHQHASLREKVIERFVASAKEGTRGFYRRLLSAPQLLDVVKLKSDATSELNDLGLRVRLKEKVGEKPLDISVATLGKDRIILRMLK